MFYICLFVYIQVAADDDDGISLDRRCSAGDTYGSGRKRRHLASTDVDEDDSDSGLEDGAGAELVSGDLVFKPLFIISKWVERTTLVKRLTVAVILPSGIGSGDFTISVVDGGQYLRLAVLWPKPLLDVTVMHRWKLGDPNNGFMCYHPSVLGFESALRELRKRSSDAVESIARIPLPFVVQTELVSKKNLAFREGGGTRMLYVELRAAEVEEYGVVADTDAFTDV